MSSAFAVRIASRARKCSGVANTSESESRAIASGAPSAERTCSSTSTRLVLAQPAEHNDALIQTVPQLVTERVEVVGRGTCNNHRYAVHFFGARDEITDGRAGYLRAQRLRLALARPDLIPQRLDFREQFIRS